LADADILIDEFQNRWLRNPRMGLLPACAKQFPKLIYVFVTVLVRTPLMRIAGL